MVTLARTRHTRKRISINLIFHPSLLNQHDTIHSIALQIVFTSYFQMQVFQYFTLEILHTFRKETASSFHLSTKLYFLLSVGVIACRLFHKGSNLASLLNFAAYSIAINKCQVIIVCLLLLRAGLIYYIYSVEKG